MNSDDKSYYRVPVPKPILRLFSKVPLRTYPSNRLPALHLNRNENTLFIFTTAEDSARGAPSFNPGCLKWQTLLKFRNIQFTTLSSNNHASPSGALPFLLPGSPGHDTNSSPSPIATSKLHSFTPSSSNKLALAQKEPPSEGPYHTLLSHTIRIAYLYALYLTPRTFSNVAAPLYVHPSSSSRLVRQALTWPLRAAALEEIEFALQGQKIDDLEYSFGGVNAPKLLADAEAAFGALSQLLGSNEWFLEADSAEQTRTEGPGFLDAAVFAYTHVLLTLFSDPDANIDPPARELSDSVRAYQNLVSHRDRILQQYYP